MAVRKPRREVVRWITDRIEAGKSYEEIEAEALEGSEQLQALKWAEQQNMIRRTAAHAEPQHGGAEDDGGFAAPPGDIARLSSKAVSVRRHAV